MHLHRMVLIMYLIIIVIIIILIVNNRREQQEVQRRQTPYHFTDGFTEKEFKQIVHSSISNIKRITTYHVDGPFVYCTVIAQSGISMWNFMIDFNYYGHITGWYTISTENDDSNIPKIVADRISKKVQELYNCRNY